MSTRTRKNALIAATIPLLGILVWMFANITDPSKALWAVAPLGLAIALLSALLPPRRDVAVWFSVASGASLLLVMLLWTVVVM